MPGCRRHPLARFEGLERFDAARGNLEFEGEVPTWRLVGVEFHGERKRLVPLLVRVESDRSRNRIVVRVVARPGQDDPLARVETWQLRGRLVPEDRRFDR